MKINIHVVRRLFFTQHVCFACVEFHVVREFEKKRKTCVVNVHVSTYQPHTIPPGIIPTEYKAEMMLAVEGAKWKERITGSWKNIA